jgi:NAD(P)-dependent dehydrogenase (short-subunit alcohol dehydrogenase family)
VDSLREEVNPDGVRVVRVYPGWTATPRQAKIHTIEEKAYAPSVSCGRRTTALTVPRTSELTDVKVRPMLKH